MNAQGFLCGFPAIVSVVSINPRRSQSHMYSLLVYKKNNTQTFQYTRTINGTASLVEAISSIQKEFKSTGHYKIQSVTCSCANVDRSETKEMMKNQRQRLIHALKASNRLNNRFQEMQSKVE